jgi:hypothetical protein
MVGGRALTTPALQDAPSPFAQDMPAVPSTLKKKRPRLLFSPGEAVGTNSKLLRESIGRWMLVALFDTGQRPVGRHERNVLQAEPQLQRVR